MGRKYEEMAKRKVSEEEINIGRSNTSAFVLSMVVVSTFSFSSFV